MKKVENSISGETQLNRFVGFANDEIQKMKKENFLLRSNLGKHTDPPRGQHRYLHSFLRRPNSREILMAHLSNAVFFGVGTRYIRFEKN